MDMSTLLRVSLAGLLAGSTLVGTAAYASAAAPTDSHVEQVVPGAERGVVDQLYRIRVSAPLGQQ
jgi:hypothetical protein